MGAGPVSEGRRTLKVNLGRECGMCKDDPRLFGHPIKPERIPHYGTINGMTARLMICAIHDRAGVRIPTA